MFKYLETNSNTLYLQFINQIFQQVITYSNTDFPGCKPENRFNMKLKVIIQ